ncbi:hypothetical protein ACL1FJ_00720 [Corynebacterium striatum]
MTFVVTDFEGRSPGDVWADWLRDWDDSKPGSFVFESDEGISSLTIPVRLSADSEVGSPERQPDDSGFFTVVLSLVFDSGCWEKTYSSNANSVTVTNWGDSLVFPTITWQGAGGVVTTPSGSTFTLPAAANRRFLLLDSAESYLVVDEKENVDDSLWHAVRGKVISAPVVPGKEATWKLPSGVGMTWKIGVINPWR